MAVKKATYYVLHHFSAKNHNRIFQVYLQKQKQSESPQDFLQVSQDAQKKTCQLFSL